MDSTSAEIKSLIVDLTKLGHKRVYQRGEWIYREQDVPQFLYFVENGLVGLLKMTASGQESLLRVFKEGQFFGHRSLFSEENYHASSRGLEPSEILLIEKSKVLQLFSERPSAYAFLARNLAKELRRAEERSLLVSEAQIVERVASALLLFKKLHPEHLWTRTEIASYCASRTPTVIKALAELEERGAIKQSRRYIEIIDESVLISFLDL